MGIGRAFEPAPDAGFEFVVLERFGEKVDREGKRGEGRGTDPIHFSSQCLNQFISVD